MSIGFVILSWIGAFCLGIVTSEPIERALRKRQHKKHMIDRHFDDEDKDLPPEVKETYKMYRGIAEGFEAADEQARANNALK